MMSLEQIFKREAVSLKNSIDSTQLQQLLWIENGSGHKLADTKLCDELVDHYGSAGVINFDNFKAIWSDLKNMRSQFDKFANMGMLPSDAFKIVLEQVAGQRIKSSFIKKIQKFYKNQITFDLFIHAVHHVRVMSDKFNLHKTANLMDEFMKSVNYFKPSTPSASDIITFTRTTGL